VKGGQKEEEERQSGGLSLPLPTTPGNSSDTPAFKERVGGGPVSGISVPSYAAPTLYDINGEWAGVGEWV
jgi:hypothetical protein